jgi:hypothetical protein
VSIVAFPALHPCHIATFGPFDVSPDAFHLRFIEDEMQGSALGSPALKLAHLKGSESEWGDGSA